MPWNDPDSVTYKLTSLVIFGLSLAGRQYAAKNNMPRIIWTGSALMVPSMYYLAISKKEKRLINDGCDRRSLEENLDFYPITRRAWNRAVAIRKAELGMEDTKTA